MPDIKPKPATDRGLVPGPRRFFLLLSVAACAASGLVYELALISLSTSLNGGGIVETSLIVAGYVAALGLGALCAKPLLKWAETAFLWVEAILGVVGGPVSYTHLTLPTTLSTCRSRWSPYH